MSLIQSFMPTFRLRQVDHVAVRASPERAWETARHFDFYQLGFVKRLFQLRVLPDIISARLRDAPPPPFERSTVDDIAHSESGFQILAEAPGSEVVVGAIGRFWQPKIDWADVLPEGFASFDEAGYGKVAWNIRVAPHRSGGSWITIEVRVTTTDERSWGTFKKYWRVIGQFSHLMRRRVLHALQKELGEAADEASLPLPGDELLKEPMFNRTHVRLIDAPPAKVWPWLVQMGCRRAGWYSFDRLDNGGVRSADRIIPELQKLEVGDLIPATPKGEGAFGVLRMDREHALVLGSPSLMLNAKVEDTAAYRSTWAFVLAPIGDDATELTVRTRASAVQQTAKLRFTRLYMAGLHELMERKQLRTVKRRVETAERRAS